MLPMFKFPPFFIGQIGVPGSDTPLGLRTNPEGIVIYVDQNHPEANDNADGTDPRSPKATIQAAINACTSGHGDFIRVMPGSYVENLTVTKDFLTIEGIQLGYGRPDIEGDRGVALTVHAEGFVAKGLRFAAAAAEDAVVQQGNGFFYFDCVFDGDGANDLNLLPDVLDDHWSASEGLILDCLFRGGLVGIMFTNPGPPAGVGPTDNRIINCRFYNHTTNDICDLDTPGSNLTCFLDSLIAGCCFLEVGAAYVYIKLDNGASNAGLIAGNFFADADVLNTQVVLTAATFFIGNFDGTGIAAL